MKAAGPGTDVREIETARLGAPCDVRVTFRLSARLPVLPAGGCPAQVSRGTSSCPPAGVHLRLGGWWTGWHGLRLATRQLPMSVLPSFGSATPGRARRPEDDFALAINAVPDCLPAPEWVCRSGCEHPEVHLRGAGGGQANVGATRSMSSSGLSALRGRRSAPVCGSPRMSAALNVPAADVHQIGRAELARSGSSMQPHLGACVRPLGCPPSRPRSAGASIRVTTCTQRWRATRASKTAFQPVPRRVQPPGGAYAASKYLITSTEQISPSV